VAAGLWLISTGGLVQIIVGAVAVLFFGMGLVMFGARLVFNPVLLQIDEEGYVDRSSLATPGRISWSEVAAVSIGSIGPHRFLEITISDPEAVLRRAGPLRRIVMRANKAAGFATVTIAEIALPYPLETLIETMRSRNPHVIVLPP
jgi:hypothetical protein